MTAIDGGVAGPRLRPRIIDATEMRRDDLLAALAPGDTRAYFERKGDRTLLVVR